LCFLAAELCGKYFERNGTFSARQDVSISGDFAMLITSVTLTN
jgi:hypothetical protein